MTNPTDTARRIDPPAERLTDAFVEVWETQIHRRPRRFLVSRPQRVIGQQEYVRLVTLGRAGHCWPGSQDAAHHRQFGVCDDADATGLALDFFGIPTTYQPMNHP